MDPDMVLAQIRSALEAFERSRREPTDQDDVLRDLETVAEGFGHLDEWLTRGGFPPNAWTAAFAAERKASA